MLHDRGGVSIFQQKSLNSCLKCRQIIQPSWAVEAGPSTPPDAPASVCGAGWAAEGVQFSFAALAEGVIEQSLNFDSNHSFDHFGLVLQG